MSDMYSVALSVAASALQDLFELKSAAGKGIKLHAIHIGQSSDTDSEQLRVQIKRATGAYTSGSGGTTPTPQPLGNDSASSFTAEMNNTTQAVAGSGALSVIHEDAFNVLNGWIFQPTPECRPIAFNGDAIIVSLPAAPLDSLTLTLTAYVEELG